VQREISKISDNPSSSSLIFGRMLSYKRVGDLLLKIPSVAHLVLAGAFDKPFLLTCVNIIESRQINVIVINRYIVYPEAYYLFARAKAILLTNNGDSSIISGIVYNILTAGIIVVTFYKTMLQKLEESYLGLK
jgi:hypothetical protein